MIETTPNARTRDAIRTAHAERGQALNDVIAWIFRRKSSH
ncbi:hypothetical protein TR2A62_2177 [Thalassobium sp. R2A62]|jgi:hypothetical protein|nr:hypothetical protein TR2A62_2177 [Thalassobium sp. R2A62]